ncbi:MAG: hypothetical protein Q8O99_06575 [bacterium]|nr:hypothetical protein [bacterium]
MGKFNIYIILSIITLADVLTDIRYRWIGTKVNSSRRVQRYITKSDLLKNHLSTMKHFWARHTGKTMFLGKQAYGLSVPIIISAGMCHMPLQRFLAYSIPVSFVQGSILLFV